MTAMEQIEAICVKARAEGLTYGQYIKKYPDCMPKPDLTPRKEIEYYDGIEREKYKDRKGTTIVCKCGAKFVAKRKDAKYCPKCKREEARKGAEARRKRKKQEAKLACLPKQPKAELCDLPPIGGFHDI